MHQFTLVAGALVALETMSFNERGLQKASAWAGCAILCVDAQLSNTNYDIPNVLSTNVDLGALWRHWK